MRKLLTLGAAGVLAFSSILAVPSAAQAAGVKYANCAAVAKKYPFGIATAGAKDKVTSDRKPVTRFTVRTADYNANKNLDTDKDKIICELPKFKTCAGMNKVYKHGVGKAGAKDKTTNPKKVTNFLVNSNLYALQDKTRDADKDGIACEKL